jgi:uncharacterized membrane protein
MLKFLKSAILNGLLILLPVLFLFVVLKELLQLLIGLATPIADLLPSHIIDSFPDISVLAVLLIFCSSLIIGILALLPVGAAIGRLIERIFLEKLPVYRPIKTLLQALLGTDASQNFKPALILYDNDTIEPAYVVEDAGRPRLVVLIPWTPNSFAGSLKLVPRERVHYLDLSLDEFSLSIGHYGVGLSSLLPEDTDKSRSETQE